MKSFVEELKIKKVLSKEDVVTLKNYIGEKYMDYSSCKKSDILAHAVYQIIDKNAEGLENIYSNEVRLDLMKNTILKDGRPIFLIDIFDICVSMKDKPEDFTPKLMKWANLHVENKISEAELKMYDSSTNMRKGKSISKTVRAKCVICVLLANIFIFQNMHISESYYIPHQNDIITSNLILNSAKTKEKTIISDSGLPGYFAYKEINQNRLNDYLQTRDSLIAEEPYFSTIISVAKKCNINPLVFFAIAGAEQSFVPKQSSSSKKIANNPFNVYHSWKEYNTNIEDASTIAGATIINLCKDRPQGKEPFEWINRKYAENSNWGKIVKEIYEELEKNDLGLK